MPNPKQLPTRSNHIPGSGWQELAQIHKGAEKPEGKPGKNLKHFRLAWNPQFAYLQPDFEAIYGKEPDIFRNVFLIGSDADTMFPHAFEDITASGVQRVCDGNTIIRWFDQSIGRMNRTPRPCEFGQCQCKMKGHLRLIFGDFSKKTHVWGYFAFHITSEIEVNRIASMLYESERALGDNLPAMPFVLGRAIESPLVAKRDNKGNLTGGRIRLEQSLVYLRLDEKATPLLTGGLLGEPLALPAPEPELDDEFRSDTPPEKEAMDISAYDNVLSEMAYAYPNRRTQLEGIFRLGTLGFIRPEMERTELIALLRTERGRHAETHNDDSKWTTSLEEIGSLLSVAHVDEATAIKHLDRFADYDCSSIAYWRSSKSAALAAIMAGEMGYDLNQMPANIGQGLQRSIAYVCAEIANPQR